MNKKEVKRYTANAAVHAYICIGVETGGLTLISMVTKLYFWQQSTYELAGE